MTTTTRSRPRSRTARAASCSRQVPKARSSSWTSRRARSARWSAATRRGSPASTARRWPSASRARASSRSSYTAAFAQAAAAKCHANDPTQKLVCATPATVVNDAPEVFDLWRPKNFETGEYQGPMRLREALAKSINTVSIRITYDIKPETVVGMAHRLGIQSDLPNEMSLALGAGEVTPLELVNAYATLAAGGVYAKPRFIDAYDGVATAADKGEQAVAPEVAYVMTDTMRSVVTEGTAAAIGEKLKMPIAGKTGTSNDARDTWFIGATPDYVIGVWIGYDDNRPMPGEQGAKVAAPVFLDIAQHMNLPSTPFVRPPHVVDARIDRQTGLLAPDGAPKNTTLERGVRRGHAADRRRAEAGRGHAGQLGDRRVRRLRCCALASLARVAARVRRWEPPRRAPTASSITSSTRSGTASTSWRRHAARQLVPPVPVAVAWHPQKLGPSLDLGAAAARARRRRSRRRWQGRALRGDDARGDRAVGDRQSRARARPRRVRRRSGRASSARSGRCRRDRRHARDRERVDVRAHARRALARQDARRRSGQAGHRVVRRRGRAARARAATTSATARRRATARAVATIWPAPTVTRCAFAPSCRSPGSSRSRSNAARPEARAARTPPITRSRTSASGSMSPISIATAGPTSCSPARARRASPTSCASSRSATTSTRRSCASRSTPAASRRSRWAISSARGRSSSRRCGSRAPRASIYGG